MVVDELVLKVRARRDLPRPPERRALRQRARLSTGDLADALDVTRQAVEAWETGRSEPRGQNLIHYAEVLRMLREELGDEASIS